MRNSVMLIGRPGAEPEVKNLNNNNKVARFRLAVNEGRMNANHEWVNDTQWFNLVAWGKTADRVANNVRKGLQIAIEGSLRNNEWTDDKGQRHTSTEIFINDLFLIDKVKE
jgi:single-strand DNA-binding protein